MDAMIRNLLGRLRRVEDTAATPRKGVVTAIAPLSVALGGSTTAYTGVKAIGGLALAIGDAVSVITYGNDLVVVGRIGAGADILRGTILTTGAVNRGGGFTATRVGVGYYRITYAVAYATLPVPTFATNAADTFINLFAETTSLCEYKTRSAGAAVDATVWFTVLPA